MKERATSRSPTTAGGERERVRLLGTDCYNGPAEEMQQPSAIYTKHSDLSHAWAALLLHADSAVHAGHRRAVPTSLSQRSGFSFWDGTTLGRGGLCRNRVNTLVVNVESQSGAVRSSYCRAAVAASLELSDRVGSGRSRDDRRPDEGVLWVRKNKRPSPLPGEG